MENPTNKPVKRGQHIGRDGPHIPDVCWRDTMNVRSGGGTGLGRGRRESDGGKTGLGSIIVASAVGIGRSVVRHCRIGLWTTAVAGCSASGSRGAGGRRSRWISTSVDLHVDIGMDWSGIDDGLDQTRHLHLGVVSWKREGNSCFTIRKYCLLG